jgi:hypothetical protein
MCKKFQFLDNDIDISDFYDKLAPELKELIAEAEMLDRQGNEGELLGICEAIECISKLYVPDELSEEEWDRLCDKYYTY